MCAKEYRGIEMHRLSRDDKCLRLDRTLAYLGFHKRLEHYGIAGRTLPERIEYIDIRGNGLSFNFRKDRKGEMTANMRFNESRSCSWQQFEVFLEELCDTVEGWLKEDAQPRILGSAGVRKNTSRSLRAKDVVAAIRTGMDDSALMVKYGLTPQGLTKLMDTLVWQGLISRTELAERKAAEIEKGLPVYQCATCSELQFAMLAQCPHCGGKMSPKGKHHKDETS